MRVSELSGEPWVYYVAPMRCVYLDHTTSSVAALGLVHQRLVDAPPTDAHSGLLLHTCHRVEWYAGNEAEPPVPDLRDGATVLGRSQALSRLSQVASGARSLVVGDRLVLQQVIDAGARLPDDSIMRDFVTEAVEIATEARQRFDLTPAVDYADVPRVLRSQETSGAKQGSLRMILVGGGMLAQAIAVGSGAAYGDVVMVTRSTSRLRRTMAAAHGQTAGITVSSSQHALTNHAQVPFDLVIASASSNPTYLQNVRGLARHDNVNLVLDFTATSSFSQRPSSYHHISDPGMIQWLRDSNLPVERRAAQAVEWIEERAAAASVDAKSGKRSAGAISNAP